MEVEWKAAIHAQRHLGVKPRITLASALHVYGDSRRGTSYYTALLSQVRVLQNLTPESAFMAPTLKLDAP